MEAKELRIGNYIMFSDNNGISYRKISCIKINEFGFYSDIDGVNLGICKPIPLTEEWLLKFGFEKDIEYDNTFNLGIPVLNGFTTITIDVRAEVLLLDCMEIKIKHVHQLQNLYFALTGTHLTLK